MEIRPRIYDIDVQKDNMEPDFDSFISDMDSKNVEWPSSKNEHPISDLD